MKHIEFLYKKYNIKYDDLNKYNKIYDELKNCKVEELQKIQVLLESRMKVLPYIIGFFVFIQPLLLWIPQIVSMIIRNELYKFILIITYFAFLFPTWIFLIFKSKKIYLKVYEGSIVSEICKNLLKT